MADVSGYRLTTNIGSDQARVDMASAISLLEPSSQPLTVFTRAAGKESTGNKKFQWQTDALRPRFDAINNSGGYNTSATSIVVDHGGYFAAQDTVLNTRTGELFRVTAVSTNTLTVVRGISNSGTGVAMNDDDEVMIVASATEEGATSRTPRSNNPVTVFNYTQIFREPFAESGTAQATENQVSPVDWALQTKKAGIEHAKDIEYAFLLGKKDVATVNSSEMRFTGGLIHQISTNQVDAGGALTEDEFNSGMALLFRYGSPRKLALGSAVFVSALNKFPASKQITTNNEKTYGMDVTTFTSPFGTLKLVYHPLLEGSKYGGYGVVVDLDDVRYRYLAANGFSRDTALHQNIQENDRDGRKAEYLTECGPAWGNEKKHGVFTGVTS